MRTPSLLAGIAVIAVSFCLSGQGLAQGQQQSIMKVDVTKISTGFRAAKIIGADVVNASNESIGKIDDVIISADGKAPYAILSVGGFLGMGTHLIAIPYESLRVIERKIMLPTATKEQLKILPEFKYAKD